MIEIASAPNTPRTIARSMGDAQNEHLRTSAATTDALCGCNLAPVPLPLEIERRPNGGRSLQPRMGQDRSRTQKAPVTWLQGERWVRASPRAAAIQNIRRLARWRSIRVQRKKSCAEAARQQARTHLCAHRKIKTSGSSHLVKPSFFLHIV